MSALSWPIQSVSALLKFSSARLRRLGIGGIHPHWEDRAAICERCPMRFVKCGVSYCGKPFLQQMDRDPIQDGCGCPCREKAKDPSEHCPVNAKFQASRGGADCNCKWCDELPS